MPDIKPRNYSKEREKESEKWTRIGARIENWKHDGLVKKLRGEPIAQFIIGCVNRYLGVSGEAGDDVTYSERVNVETHKCASCGGLVIVLCEVFERDAGVVVKFEFRCSSESCNYGESTSYRMDAGSADIDTIVALMLEAIRAEVVEGGLIALDGM